MNELSTEKILREADIQLRKSGLESPKLESEILLAHILSCSRIDLYKREFDKLSQEKNSQFQVLLKRRCLKEPIAHLTGHKEFCGHLFQVTPDTLIPRPETELLVEEIASYFSETPGANTLIDLGTGTGCIPLSLAKENQQLNIKAVDLSSGALSVAKQNKKQLGLEKKQILFEQADILNSPFWEKLGKFHVIVSNPPYIGQQEEKDLEQDVLAYEPHKALFAKKEGLEFYQVFASQAKKHLFPLGKLFLELSPIIYNDVCQVFEKKGWTLEKTILDYSGHKRHIILS